MASPSGIGSSSLPESSGLLLSWGIVLYFLLTGGGIDEAPDALEAPTSTVAEPAAPPSGETGALPEAAPIVLPPLSTSDDFVRAMVEKLSAHPVLASFVVTEQLVRKAVVVVANVAEGLSPARLFPVPSIYSSARTEGASAIK